MSDKPQYDGRIALKIAREVMAILKPFVAETPASFGWPDTHLIAIAGSLRRQKATVGDMELVFVPKTGTAPDGLFDQKTIDLAHEQINAMLAAGVLAKRASKSGVFTWGEENKLGIHVPSGIPMDLFSTSAERWWNTLVIRTGSKDTNLLLTTGANKLGRTLRAYGEGITDKNTGISVRSTSERHVFELCGVPYKEPKYR